jgi:hypothetical protein
LRPVVAEILGTAKNQYQAKHDSKQQHNKASSERWTIVIAGMTVAILIGQALVFWYQAIQLKKTVGTMTDTAERQLRAYISAKPVFIASFGPEIYSKWHYVIKNHGSTPAFKMRQRGLIEILPYPLPDDFVFPEMGPFAKNRPAIHPGDELKTIGSAKRLFTLDEIQDAIQGESRRFYSFGVGEYTDCFGIVRTPTSAIRSLERAWLR